MPSENHTASPGDPDFVLGDAYGSACDPILTGTAHRFLEKAGYRVRRNDPYAGGYVTRHYGRPRSGCHALQIEIARRLYVDQLAYRKLADFVRIEALVSGLLVTLREAATTLATG